MAIAACGSTAEIEGEDLVVAVAAELHRHQRQQHRFARAGRPTISVCRRRRRVG